MPDDQRIHRTNSQNSTAQNLGGKEAGSAQALSETRGLSPKSSHPKKVALVHDWLNGMRGGEIVFEALLDLYPDADVYTLIYAPMGISDRLNQKLSRTRVHTSWLNRYRLTRNRYRQLLPLLPFAIRSFDVSKYDLIISSSHCVAKGVKKSPQAFHLSYIHAPMRYMWDRFGDYFGKGRIHFVFRITATLLRPLLQWWDRKTAGADRVDVLIGNSQFIAEQIFRCYGRKAEVVYPFAKLERFSRPRRPGNFYLMVGAFAPYKRTDIAIEAFARLGLPLKIVGSGQDQVRLRSLRDRLHAPNVEFVEKPSNELIEALYSECKAFIFPGKEDFGITPLEAMAAGAPVIAFGEGGAAETVVPESGILFSEQTVESLSDAVMEIESGRRRFQEEECRARAGFFTESRFKQEILNLIPSRYQI